MRDRQRREQILIELRGKLAELGPAVGQPHSQATCALRTHERYGPYLTTDGKGRLKIDAAKVRAEARLDGKYLLRTSDDTLSKLSKLSRPARATRCSSEPSAGRGSASGARLRCACARSISRAATSTCGSASRRGTSPCRSQGNLIPTLQRHINRLQLSADDYLFPSRQGAHLSSRRAAALVKAMVVRANRELPRAVRILEAATIHWLRYTYARTAADSGVPIDVIADLLGHEDIDTTRRIYLGGVNPERMRAAVATMFGDGYSVRRPRGKSSGVA